MENLLSFYKKSDGKTKKQILSCIFSEKFVLEKGRVATTPFSVPVKVLINTNEVLEGTKNKKEVENDLLSIMAPPVDERCSLDSVIESLSIKKNTHKKYYSGFAQKNFGLCVMYVG